WTTPPKLSAWALRGSYGKVAARSTCSRRATSSGAYGPTCTTSKPNRSTAPPPSPASSRRSARTAGTAWETDGSVPRTTSSTWAGQASSGQPKWGAVSRPQSTRTWYPRSGLARRCSAIGRHTGATVADWAGSRSPGSTSRSRRGAWRSTNWRSNSSVSRSRSSATASSASPRRASSAPPRYPASTSPPAGSHSASRHRPGQVSVIARALTVTPGLPLADTRAIMRHSPVAAPPPPGRRRPGWRSRHRCAGPPAGSARDRRRGPWPPGLPWPAPERSCGPVRWQHPRHPAGGGRAGDRGTVALVHQQARPELGAAASGAAHIVHPGGEGPWRLLIRAAAGSYEQDRVTRPQCAAGHPVTGDGDRHQLLTRSGHRFGGELLGREQRTRHPRYPPVP